MKESVLEAVEKVKGTLNRLIFICQKQHLAINPKADVVREHTDVILKIKNDVKELLEKIEMVKQADVNVTYYGKLQQCYNIEEKFIFSLKQQMKKTNGFQNPILDC